MSPADDPDGIVATSPARDDITVHSPSDESAAGEAMATIVEGSQPSGRTDDTPLKRLLTLSREVSEEAVTAKSVRMSSDDLRKNLESKEHYDTMISSLPESAIRELAHEMVGLCEEAENLGAVHGSQSNEMIKKALKEQYHALLSAATADPKSGPTTTAARTCAVGPPHWPAGCAPHG